MKGEKWNIYILEVLEILDFIWEFGNKDLDLGDL